MSRVHNESAGVALLGGAAACCVGVVLALAAWLAYAGFAPFWPTSVVEVSLRDGAVVLGERVAQFDDAQVLRSSEVERLGGAYRRLRPNDVVAAAMPRNALAIELADGRRLFARNAGDAAALLAAASANESDVVERVAPNALGFGSRCVLFVQRIARFVGGTPDTSNVSGGVLPALIGTLTLVLLMSVLAMPLGVATAVFLHQRRGAFARVLRGAIDMLAGMPAILYGVLGLGLFVHGLGARIDAWFFADRLPVPTFGSGGLLWAAVTLALLTLPVVVVSVERGLAGIPAPLREGSLALGATREETMWRLLLPLARPAILGGFALAIARAAGSVAPLMLVGVVKLAPALPFDSHFPYFHPSAQFMHLGFSVYDASMASPDALRGVPRAYACAALLVLLVLALNLSAIVLRNRLHARQRMLEPA